MFSCAAAWYPVVRTGYPSTTPHMEVTAALLAPATKKWLPKQRIAVWKYNMRAHWLRMHPHTPMPAGLADAIALAPGERDLLRKGRGFPVVVRKK